MASTYNVDQALDGLSFSFLDGVPFHLDRRIESVINYDYSRVNELLADPTSSVLNVAKYDDLISHMGQLEKQVLKQLDDLQAANEARKEREKRDLEEYEQKQKECKYPNM